MWFQPKHGRSKGFKLLRKMVMQRKMQTPIIIETGTLRNERIDYREGDGWSTLFFRKLIDDIGGELHSVDIDPEAIATSKRVTEREFGNLRNTFHHIRDSVSFLREFLQQIDILYLDSMNYTHDDSAARHQLAEIQACIDKLSSSGIILVDDIYETLEYGKPALSIPFMKEHGWTEVQLIPVAERAQKQWYQAIITRKQR